MLGLAALILITSCIDQRYDINKGLSTSINFGGDSLALPLGSSDTIRLGDFLDPADVELMKTMEDGGYALNVKDSIEVDVPKIDQSSLKIDEKTFTQEKAVSFGDINLEDFSIDGLSINSDIKFDFNAISLSDFEVTNINETESFGAGMSGYIPDDLTVDNINAEGGTDNLFTTLELPSYGGIPSIPVPILNQPPVNFNATQNVNYTINAPEGVTNIGDVLLKDVPEATFTISLELIGGTGVITTGKIVPEITVNPTDLFEFKNLPGGTIVFSAEDSLTVANGFKLERNYPISALNIGGNPDEQGNLSVSDQIVSTGSVAMRDVYVLSDKINNVKDMDMVVKVSVNDMVIKSMVFTLPPIQSNIDGNTAMDINNSLPSDIKQIRSILLDANRQKLRFVLKAAPGTLPPMEQGSFTINDLSIQFPSEITFKPKAGLSGSTYSLSNETFDPNSGFPIELELASIDLSAADIVGDSIKWSRNITYSGNVSFSGRVNSADIPSGSNDTRMDLVISSDFGFHSANVVTSNKTIDITPMNIPFDMDIDISDRIKRLDTIKLKDNTIVTININKPTIPLTLTGEGLTLVFPDLFTFDPPLINNRIIFNDTTRPLPELIELELASLNINDTLSEKGTLSINEQIQVQGGVLLKSGLVNTTEVEDLDEVTLNLIASSEKMTIASTSLLMKSLSTTYADSTRLDLPTIDLPEEILSLDSIMLANGAKLLLDINISNMPSLSKPLIADIKMDFPALLGFAPGLADANNNIHIHQAFVGGKLSKEIGLDGLFFDGKNLGGKLDINEMVKFNVGVSVDESTVNSDQLKNEDIIVRVDVKLTGIQFEDVYGKLDPGIEPQHQSIAISGLPSFLEGDSIVLDITKPVITLETESNLGIPVVIDLLMKPSRKGSVIAGAEQTMQLTLPKAASASSKQTTRFWIAPDSAGMPQDYVFVPANIQMLFRTIPDNILFDLQASADISQQHHINLSADYFMKVNYEVTVPFAFGEELAIVMRDTISGLDPMIGESALAGKALELYGSFQNSIPLELEVELVPFDGNNAPIDVTPVRQTIGAGARDGSPTTSNVTLKLVDPDGKLEAMRGVELIFRGSSNSTVAGAPIKPDNYVIATLKARLAGGITIDPSNF